MRPLAIARRGLAVTALVLASLLAFLAPRSTAYVPADLDRLFGASGLIVSPAGSLDLPTKHSLLRDRGGAPIGAFRRLLAAGACDYAIQLDRFAANDGSLTGSSEIPVGAPCSPPLGSQVAIGQDSLGDFYVATGEGASIRLTRLLPDGTVDPSFGITGTKAIATTQPVAPEQLKVGPEGELSLTGVASPVANAGPTEMFLARITPEGNLDPAFRGGGIGFFDIGLGESTPEPSALEIGPDGETYLAGPISRSTAGHVWTPAGVWAFLPDGQADRRFGRSGFARLRGNEAPAMTLSQGRLLVATNGDGPRIVRLTRAGKLDRSFGSDGSVSLPAKQDFRVAEMALDPAGRIVLAGTTGCCIPARRKKLAVRRLERDGEADRTFAGGGFFFLPPYAEPQEAISVEGLYLSSGNAGGGITVSGSIAERCPPNCPAALTSTVRFRLEGQSSHERCQGRRATVVGTSRGETLVGTDRADTIAGLDGNDRIFGRGGNDLICGGKGVDRLSGGPGRDRVTQF